MRLEPEDVKIVALEETANFGRYTIEPLPAGYGYTLGNSLRRVLLSSLKGWAVTQMELEGVNHQFSFVKGVKEDVIQLGLNIKKLRFKVFDKDSVVCEIDEVGPKVVKAKDIKLPSGVSIVNDDIVIATISDKSARLKMSLLVEPGYGYAPSEERKSNKIGVIPLDAIYSPIINAAFSVLPTRMGQKTGLDKVVLEIKTDGTTSPKKALTDSAVILRGFFGRIVNPKESLKEEIVESEVKVVTPSYNPSEVLVDELRLPTRTINALKKAKMKTLEDLAKMTDEDLLKVRNLGEKSIKEIAKLLKKEGLKEQ
ncbi:DNA-directed RNA polymerase subunit alpha [candidate division WWE3 bacterium CG08_land_8_20_14_0_20_40_13]|uniref:DNA-directed RNA polymerase subunit alpha n=1 Tax=candidate division WWE3 bacterium CG08_land_8_20_14_0_20_40_13 TaxID=1975084 RepID=A0A2H0XEK1_UNCKA|nr:MAG: DNA-directed RNA polymerase subunit alpha [candidate division WWE3 bacterium CG08_land_8_20_14_0_20_40_13]